MNRSIIPLLCSFLLLSASSSSAFDITKILSQYPDYSSFNDLLTKTGLAGDLNGRTTITVLAVPNGAIGDLTSKPNDVVKSILTTHVVLDYYDPVKLQHLKDGTTKLTTMFQQSGKAVNDQGFLNVTTKDNAVVFGSAVKDAQRDSRLEKSVMNQPYNISILGISQPIVTPGIGSTLAPASAQPPVENTPKSLPPKVEAPAQKEAEAPSKPIDAPLANAQAPSKPIDAPLANAQAPSKPTDAPLANAQSPSSSKDANSPSAESPLADAKSPSSSKSASSPSTESPPADAQSPSSSSAEKVKVSFGLFVVLASMLAAY